jgi:hypothetical protein
VIPGVTPEREGAPAGARPPRCCDAACTRYCTERPLPRVTFAEIAQFDTALRQGRATLDLDREMNRALALWSRQIALGEANFKVGVRLEMGGHSGGSTLPRFRWLEVIACPRHNEPSRRTIRGR